MADGQSFYKEYPKTLARDDFWRQVKRTVNGEPVAENQIEMIVAAVRKGLELEAGDRLLDLCCGNGALSDRFFGLCRSGLGVDFSAALIDIAKEFFEKTPHRLYQLGDVVAFSQTCKQPESFSKALCYGSFMYLPRTVSDQLLAVLHQRFKALQTLYIGNIPDREKLHDFFTDRTYTAGIEDDPGSAIGIWYTQKEFKHKANAAGWNVTFHQMPADFYAGPYRFDAILTPRPRT